MRIKHGIPKQSPYFPIAVPYMGEPMARFISIDNIEKNTHTVIELEDPKTGEVVNVEVYDVWRHEVVADVPFLNSFCLLCFGCTIETLLFALKRKHADFTSNTVEILLVKRV